ncbi:hypothetical protein KIW84_055729 [Lathyrus oleraceus]|uniref:Uncharacterized protein n=1 Tax=Pisum sativum TaxID=3888 RepID=A0A9D4WWE5_PEA|nr:hypothetical protein KIW84_055729 [Pisum sativum]
MLQLQEPGHFIDDCPEVEKDKSKKRRYQKENFINKFKKSFMATWDELDNEEDANKDEEQANLGLMALTSSETESESDFGFESEEEDKVIQRKQVLKKFMKAHEEKLNPERLSSTNLHI